MAQEFCVVCKGKIHSHVFPKVCSGCTTKVRSLLSQQKTPQQIGGGNTAIVEAAREIAIRMK